MYLCAAMLKSREQGLVDSTVSGLLLPWLYAQTMPDVRVAMYMDYMSGLEKQFRPQILPFMLRCCMRK